MLRKINMVISNGNQQPVLQRPVNTSGLANPPAVSNIKLTPLNGSIIGRIHNAKSGCGSCGRH